MPFMVKLAWTIVLVAAGWTCVFLIVLYPAPMFFLFVTGVMTIMAWFFVSDMRGPP